MEIRIRELVFQGKLKALLAACLCDDFSDPSCFQRHVFTKEVAVRGAFNKHSITKGRSENCYKNTTKAICTHPHAAAPNNA